MNFSLRVKKEIVDSGEENACCKISSLAGFIRTAGTIEVRQGKIGFSLSSDELQIDYYRAIISEIFGLTLNKVKDNGGRVTCSAFGNKATEILVSSGIVSMSEGGASIELSIDNYLIENDCCKKAFLKGAFLGSGSVTVPTENKLNATSYHLEFVFSQYNTANCLCDLLAYLGFSAKLITRKEYTIVYIKNAEEIKDLLAVMSATKACLELADIMVMKEVRNNLNRRVNCEMSNMTKQVDASIKSREDIDIIISTIGLDKLPIKLKTVADARIENAEASLSELADTIGISKSCLCHRLKKINSIALELK